MFSLLVLSRIERVFGGAHQMNGSIPFMRLCREVLGPNEHKCESTLLLSQFNIEIIKKLRKVLSGYTKLNKVEETLNSFISCVDNPSRTVLAPFFCYVRIKQVLKWIALFSDSLSISLTWKIVGYDNSLSSHIKLSLEMITLAI